MATSGGTPTLLGIPFDGASSFLRGAATAPALIRQAMRSDATNLWTEGLVDLGAPGVFADAGEADLSGDPREAVVRAVRDVMATGGRPVILGGDHSITWPVLRAVRERHPALTILHLDAHNDLYDHFEGDRGSHACPFARIMESGLADQLVQVGIRAMTGHQRAQADRFGVDVIDMRRWVAGVRPVLRHPVYVSLDVDVLDPGCAPGVSHREPGGLSVREVLTVLQAIGPPIVGADLVEYNPVRDVDGVTAVVCGKLLKELLAAMVGPR
jgi:agmatinase